MSMQALTIIHSTGTETVDSYTVVSGSRSYAATAYQPEGGVVATVTGDGRVRPTPYIVRAHLDEGSLPDSVIAGYALIEYASTATSVRSHEGLLSVNGLMGYAVTLDGLAVDVELQFAPTSSTITP